MDIACLRERWIELLGEDPETTQRFAGATVKPGVQAAGERSPLTGPGVRSDELVARDFALIEPIGQGGMGVVYRTRELSLKREVALKMTRPELAGSRGDCVAEAVMTGRLEHPNIVPIHRLETLPDGAPCIAMKLVHGRTWQSLLQDATAIDLPEQLGILLQLSQAVAFAHSHGVVHNDLKPSNVMLGDFGEVLLMDWGLAVSFWPEAPAGFRSRAAIAGPCGTPHYMAPELAAGRGQDVGPWTDIYLLGGILYRLLTGRAPHQSESFLASVLRATSGEVAAPGPGVPEELRRIALKALQKEPSERYSDVRDFADALRAYLSHRESLTISAVAEAGLEDCLARSHTSTPASRNALYEDFAEAVAGFSNALRLWQGNPQAATGRQRARLAYARTALASGDLGLAEAQALRLDTSALEDPARAALLEALAEEKQRRQREARSRIRNRRALLASVLTIILGSLLANFLLERRNREIEQQSQRIEAQHQQIAREVERAHEQELYATERGQIAHDALMVLVSDVRETLLTELGDSHSQALARKLLEKAANSFAALRRADAARDMVSLGTATTLLQLSDLALDVEGDLAAALGLAQEGVRQLETLVQQRPDDAERRFGLALGYLRLGRVTQRKGDLEQAGQLFERCRALRAELLQDNPQQRSLKRAYSDVLAHLAEVRLHRQQLPSALQLAEEALAITSAQSAEAPADVELRRDLAMAWRDLGRIQEAAGAIADASHSFEALRGIAAEVYEQQPGDAVAAFQFSAALIHTADLLRRTGDVEEAVRRYGRALQLRQQLLDRAPDSFLVRRNLSAARFRLGMAQRELGDLEAAEASLRACVALDRELCAVQASDGARHDLAQSLLELSSLLALRRDYPEALDGACEGLELARSVAAADTSNVSKRMRLAAAFSLVGHLLTAVQEIEAGREHLRQALAHERAILALETGDASARRNLSLTLARLARGYELEGRLQDAQAWNDECVRLRRDLHAEAAARDLQPRHDLAWALLDAARVFEKRGLAGKVRPLVVEAEELFAGLAVQQPGNPSHGHGLFVCATALARSELQTGTLARVRPWLARARERAANVSSRELDLAAWRALLMEYGFALHRAGVGEETVEVFVELLGWLREYARAEPDSDADRELSVGLKLLADLRWERGDAAASLPLYSEALQLQRALARAAPSAERLSELCLFLRGMAELCLELGDPAQAGVCLAEEVAALRQLEDGLAPDHAAEVWLELGGLLLEAGDLLGASEALARVLETPSPAEQGALAVAWSLRQAQAYKQLAAAQVAGGDEELAVACLLEALSAWQQAAAASAGTAEAALGLRTLLRELRAREALSFQELQERWPDLRAEASWRPLAELPGAGVLLTRP